MQLTASFHARPGHESVVRDLLAAYAAVVRTTDGTILFEPSTVAGHAEHFVVFERYRDQAAFEAHLAAAENKTFNADLAGHILGEVHLQFLDPLAP